MERRLCLWGNLRQKDWQEVANAVNARHGHNKKSRRTDVQCKNRINTLKKKYKIEKVRVSKSKGTVSSSWPFYTQLDPLIGSTVTAKKPPYSPPLAVLLPHQKSPSTMVQSVVLPQKCPFSTVDDSYSRRNYSAVATAAAASADAEEEESEDEDELEDLSWGEESGGQRDGETDSMRRLEVRLRTARLTRYWLNWQVNEMKIS